MHKAASRSRVKLWKELQIRCIKVGSGCLAKARSTKADSPKQMPGGISWLVNAGTNANKTGTGQ